MRETSSENDKTLRSPSAHGIPPKVFTRTNAVHKEVLEANKVRKHTTIAREEARVLLSTRKATRVRKMTMKAREEVLAPSNLRKRTKKWHKGELKVDNYVTVTNNHNGLRGTIVVITRLFPEQAYIRPNNGKSEFRRPKPSLKKS